MSLEAAKSLLKNSNPSASSAPLPSWGAWEGKREPPVCRQNDEGRSPEEQQQKGETSRREQSDRVDASGFYGARFRITGSPASKVVRIPARAGPMEGTFARTRLFGWKDVNPGRKS